MVYDSPVKHPFAFTPSVSLLVDFAAAEELDAAFAMLAHRSEVLMPVDNHGFRRCFGWCTDRLGKSRQRNPPDEKSATTAAAS